eukprot:COSAG02_NODE_802_length_17030_cov_37.485500_15_plen_116_part_00
MDVAFGNVQSDGPPNTETLAGPSCSLVALPISEQVWRSIDFDTTIESSVAVAPDYQPQRPSTDAMLPIWQLPLCCCTCGRRLGAHNHLKGLMPSDKILGFINAKRWPLRTAIFTS